MKRTVKINISGFIFHVDEDAFTILEKYLKTLKSRFKTSEEGNEIITDIENRIAELMQLKLSEQKQVITIDDVKDIIEIMGNPEEFIDAEDENSREQNTQHSNSKRFYRDIDNNIAGGVCAGLGSYFNIDPVILRIIFIVLSIPLAGFPVLLYFVLWIVLPPAITTAQKMEMRSDNFTISDIEQKVKSEYDNVKDNFKKIKDSEPYHRTRGNLNNIGNGFVEIINFFGKAILLIIGIALIISGIGLITSMFGVFVFSDSFLFWTHTDMHHAFIPDFLFSIVNPKSVLLATICIIIMVTAPIIAIIYWGLKLTLRFKANDKMISVVASVAWILSIIILAGITLFEAKEYAFSTQVDDNVEMSLAGNQTLYIKSNMDMDEFSEIYFFEDGLEVYTNDSYPERVYMEPDFRIRYTADDEISIHFEKEARGATNRLARENTNNIEFNWHLQDSILFIDPLFFHKNNDRWTFPDLDITLNLPEGQKVCVDKNLEQTLRRAHTAGNISTYEIPGKCWVMTRDGLDYTSMNE